MRQIQPQTQQSLNERRTQGLPTHSPPESQPARLDNGASSPPWPVQETRRPVDIPLPPPPHIPHQPRPTQPDIPAASPRCTPLEIRRVDAAAPSQPSYDDVWPFQTLDNISPTHPSHNVYKNHVPHAKTLSSSSPPKMKPQPDQFDSAIYKLSNISTKSASASPPNTYNDSQNTVLTPPMTQDTTPERSEVTPALPSTYLDNDQAETKLMKRNYQSLLEAQKSKPDYPTSFHWAAGGKDFPQGGELATKKRLCAPLKLENLDSGRKKRLHSIPTYLPPPPIMSPLQSIAR